MKTIIYFWSVLFSFPLIKMFCVFCCSRWRHQPVGACGAAGVDCGQRAFRWRDGYGFGLRGQTSGHPSQPRVLWTPQRGAMCSPVGHHLQGPPLHQGEYLRWRVQGHSFHSLKTEFTLWANVWDPGKHWAALRSCRRSASVCFVINTLHVKANCLPAFGTDRTQIPAGLFPLLMERLNRWRNGAFLTVCQDAQCNHLIFSVHPHFAGVIFGCWVPRSASTKCVRECAAELNGLRDPCQLPPFRSPDPSPNIPANCFHLSPIDCFGAQVDSMAR